MLAQIMPPVETVCSFKEGSSNVDSKCTLEELSYSLRSCEPFPVSDIDPSMSSIAQDISSSEVLAGAFNSINIVETSGQIDDDGNHNVRFDDPVEMKLHDVICSSSPRRSARVTKLIQKNQTRIAAKRCRKNVVKNEMLDSILLRVARKTRSYGCRPARSSVWGSVGITQVFENTASQVTKNRSAKSRKCRRVRGSGKGKNDQAVTGLQMSNGKTSASFGRIRLKVKLGKEMSQACLTDMVSVTENDLPDFRANGTEVHRVTNFSGHMLNDVLGVKGSQCCSKDIKKVVKLPKSIDICPGDMDLQSPVTCEKSDEFVADSHQEVPSPIEIEESGVAVDSKYLDLGTSPDSEVINLIPEAQVNGKDKSVFHDVQISSETFVAPVDIPSLKLPPKSTKKGKKSERMPHAGNFNVQDRLDSLEILNRAGVVEKCGLEEGLGDGFHFSEASISTTTANVSENPSSSERFSGELLPSSRAADMGGMFPCVKSKEQKHLKNSRSNRMSKSGSELSDSPRSQRGNACRQKGNSVKSVSRRKVKDKAACDEVVCKVENYQERGHNSSDGFRKDKTGDGNLVQEIFNTDVAHRGAGDQSLLPRNAWVRCDECLKWRRIPTTLADSIEETNCRWTCKDNVAKGFADCSIPQEKSNAEINAELEISDASCEEDACYGRVSSKRSHPNPSADRQQSSWMLIKSNMFLHRSRKSQTIDEIMVCHCKRPTDGRMGCGDGCLNRMLNIECVQGTCPCGERCSNQQFQKRKYAKLRWFRCGKKGYGLQLLEDISEGQFLIEYTGEVLDMQAYEARQREYASKGHKHFYFMTLNGSEVIDACAKGNLGRFINHSCDPNCRTEKWMVNGEVCIGLFALKGLKKGDEVTFDYNYVRVFGAAAKKCVCGSSHCRGYIGGDPRNSEVIVQGDSDEEFPEPVMIYDDGEIDDSLKKLISATSPLDDIQTSITDSEQVLGNKDKLEWTETDESANDIHHLEISPGKLGSKSALSEKPEISFEVVENSVEVLQPSVQKVKTSLQLDNASGDTISDSERVILLSPEASALAVADKKSLSDSGDTKKKYKSDISEDRLASKSSNLMKTTRLSSSVKKGKSRSSSNNSGNVSKPETMVNKSHGPPYKPKKIIEGSLNGRFEAVEEKLNELLDVDGGISKRKDATKGYLKLLLLTAASGDSGNGEVIQSNRDLSMILDALLKTKSRFVLVDIISKNGLQMLHNIMKRYRRDFSKIPILRKLLKVLEFLAAREILTLEHITRGPPCLGVESFRESILTLTEHDDKQVHQIARNFRDKWIPRPARKSTDFHRGINCNRYSVSHNHWREKSLQTTDGINCNKQSVAATATVSVDAGMQEGCSSSCSSVCQISETKTRKRKSRWDQPANTNADSGSIQTKEPHIQPGFLQSPCSSSQPESVKLAFNHMQRTNKEMPLEKSVDDGGENMDEDVPPGFAPLNAPSNDGENSFSPNCPCKVEIGRPQGRFMNRLAVSYGIPLPVVQQLGNLKTENLEDWVIAPGVPFHPFPPLPPYPRNLSEDRTDNRANIHPAICHSDKNTPSTSVYIPLDKEIEGTKHRFQEARGSHSLGRRYFRQQKWNNSKLPPPSVRNRNGWGACLGNDSRNGMCSIGGPNGSEADGNMNNACTSFPQNPQLEKFH